MNILCKPVGLFQINADNGYLRVLSLQTAIYLVQKSVDMLLHVTAGEVNICRQPWADLLGGLVGVNQLSNPKVL